MKKIIIMICLVFLGGCATQSKNVSSTPVKEEVKQESKEETGKIIAGTIYSSNMKLDWNYSIYLPKSYEASSNKKYPVLYLLHGAYGNHRNLVERFPIQQQLDTLINEGKLDETVVVFVDGFNTFYINGKGLKMESAIIEDLLPKIEEKYDLKVDRNTRYIGGISMGGYGSANLSLKYPELFSKAILISPAVWDEMNEKTATYDWSVFRDEKGEFKNEIWEENHPLNKIEGYKSKNLAVDFYVVTGKEDKLVPYEVVEKFSNELKQYTNVELVLDDDGVHAWTYWEKAMNKALEKLGEK